MTRKASVAWELGATVGPPLHLRCQTKVEREHRSRPLHAREFLAGCRQVYLSVVACIEL